MDTKKKRSGTRQRTSLVALRLLPAERDTLEAAARDQNVSLSEFIRVNALAVAALAKAEKP